MDPITLSVLAVGALAVGGVCLIWRDVSKDTEKKDENRSDQEPFETTMTDSKYGPTF
ncbi:MAG: hypothetical protein IJ852_02845 [Alphaproteobacteria bacterium]|nr:hypothetical protein [Alphaproteobacteria bacterium]